jgi:hypothetical protein
LNVANTKLKQTETELTATKEERDRSVADAADKTKRLDKTTQERDAARTERDSAQAELAAYNVIGLKPEEIIKVKNSFKALEAENGLLAQKIVEREQRIRALTNELAVYKIEDYRVPLPAGLKGKVLVTDPKWNFVVLNVGQDQEVLEQGELLVNRNGRLVAKVKVGSVQKDRSIANVMPGWQLGDIMEGDLVIPAYAK